MDIFLKTTFTFQLIILDVLKIICSPFGKSEIENSSLRENYLILFFQEHYKPNTSNKSINFHCLNVYFGNKIEIIKGFNVIIYTVMMGAKKRKEE